MPRGKTLRSSYSSAVSISAIPHGLACGDFSPFLFHRKKNRLKNVEIFITVDAERGKYSSLPEQGDEAGPAPWPLEALEAWQALHLLSASPPGPRRHSIPSSVYVIPECGWSWTISAGTWRRPGRGGSQPRERPNHRKREA